MYAFHATISIRCWFAIDIAIRYRYRSCPAFPIASSDIDSEPEKTTTPVAVCRAISFVDQSFVVPYRSVKYQNFGSVPSSSLRRNTVLFSNT
ncbi:MAG: hypothetical protein BECKG1743D_GA0114223_105565 [Candidatus Kentron sp. G]|nr:MAG: hypothetical protein BECKG1743F_GA0114225_104991 [Candidatus Kentron sp. G]VFN02675.1 MAG: hypothetical protein BECKG1743E_GA0114224_105315 [Candidatus Kentron sp. G]VFN04183.1 MAG: hypothetical protein BECKG1743D_GA0114223_105565 [Candidatus Kentron sp. G]